MTATVALPEGTCVYTDDESRRGMRLRASRMALILRDAQSR